MRRATSCASVAKNTHLHNFSKSFYFFLFFFIYFLNGFYVPRCCVAVVILSDWSDLMFQHVVVGPCYFFVEMFIHANRCSSRVPLRIRRIDQQQNEPRCGTATIAAPRRPRWSIHNQPPVPLYFLVLLLDKRLLWLWQSYEIILAKCKRERAWLCDCTGRC